jgi:hypothetical protein
VRRSLVLAPQATVLAKQALANLLQLANTKGQLRVAAPQPLALACRIYTTAPGGGTYGQGIPALPLGSFSSEARTLAGVRNRDGYRTNVGFASGTSRVNAVARLYDASGALLATRSDLSIPPASLQQFRLQDLFPGAPDPNPVGSIQVVPTGPLAVYLSVVDGTSQDPVLLLAP